jgi:hypothetical protein
MSGGGGSTQTTPTSSTSANLPWGSLQPYLIQGYQEAAKQYAAGPTKYTPWSQATGFTAPQQQAMTGISNYVNSPALQQQMASTQNVVSGLAQGAGNPYSPLTQTANQNVANFLGQNQLYNPSQGINRMMYQNTQDPALMATLNKGLGAVSNITSGLQGQLPMSDISGSIADRMRQATTAGTVANTLGAAYNQQNINRMKAADMANQINKSQFGTSADVLSQAGKYGTSATGLGLQYAKPALNAPTSMLGQLNTIGGYQQAQNQAQLTDAVNRFNFEQAAPYDNLVKFRNLMQNSTNPNWGVTSMQGTQTQYVPGSGNGALGGGLGTLAGAGVGFMMGGPAGAMLGASLGGAGGGLIGSQF